MRFKIAALFEFEGKTPPTNATDLASITPLVLKRFGFLPQPVLVTVEGDEVVIQYPEESSAAQAEAARLAERAGKRAAEGHYEKAIGILKRVLELQPSLHKARRDLAMAYVETGDIDNATNHLIEVLRLDPGDAWSWVVLANLYIREKSDKETGEKFLRKALEIAPNDAWALNSLASVTFERGKTDEAISLFEHAIQSNPEFANAYYGEAIVYQDLQQPDKSIATLERLFAHAKMQDARSKPVYDGARQLFGKLQVDLAQRNESETFKLVQNYKAEMEKLSGYPIRIQEEKFESKIGATIQMAWKHNRDFHLVKIRADYPPPISQSSRKPRTHPPQARIRGAQGWQKSFLRHHRQDAGHGHPVVCGRYPQVGKGRLFGAENHRADADAGQRALRIPVQLPARHAYRAPPARHIQAAPARAIPFRPAHGE
jgi:tetratricopeptide (TPR) repeat protein